MYKEIYLMLTELCPNRCEYCYIKNRSNPHSIPMDLIDEKIKLHNPDRVIFFGGEPLANFSLFKEVVKKYHGQFKMQIVTSTMANFKEFIEFNEEYPMSEIQLSWDGFNKNRIDSNGMDISHKTWKNIWYAIRKGLKFDIKCVISNDNVHQMVELHQIFKELKRYNVSGQFVIAHRDLYTESFYKGLKENLIKTFDLNKMYMDHLNKIIAYMNQDDGYSSCDGGKYIVIDPYGRETCCTALSQEKDIEINSDEIQKKCLDPSCNGCKYNYLCDGGCRYERYLEYGDKWKYHKLESTCMMMEIYDDTIRTWLSSLDKYELERLMYIIKNYKSYMRGYYS